MKIQQRQTTLRAGYTLIEMVIVIGAATLVMGLAASLLGALFKIERGSRAAVTDASTVSRLARHFRADVHAATSAKTITPKSGGLDFEVTQADGESTTYRIKGDQLVREIARQGEVRARETYAIERIGPLTFGVEGQRAWLLLSRRVAEGAGVSRPSIRIEAALGKDHALALAASQRKGD